MAGFEIAREDSVQSVKEDVAQVKSDTKLISEKIGDTGDTGATDKTGTLMGKQNVSVYLLEQLQRFHENQGVIFTSKSCSNLFKTNAEQKEFLFDFELENAKVLYISFNGNNFRIIGSIELAVDGTVYNLNQNSYFVIQGSHMFVYYLSNILSSFCMIPFSGDILKDGLWTQYIPIAPFVKKSLSIKSKAQYIDTISSENGVLKSINCYVNYYDEVME